MRALTYSGDQSIEQWWCEVCGHSITGGDANLLSQASKAQKNKVQESKKKKPTTITNFFTPLPKSQPPQQNPQCFVI